MWRFDSLEKTLMLGGIGSGGEGDSRGWDGWMSSLTRWTWVWVNSRSWWWTGRPGVLRFMGSQRVRHDWVTELNWTEGLWVLSWKCQCIFLGERMSWVGLYSRKSTLVISRWIGVEIGGVRFKWQFFEIIVWKEDKESNSGESSRNEKLFQKNEKMSKI